MSKRSHNFSNKNKKNSGFRILFILFAIAGVLSVVLFFVYRRSAVELSKSFMQMQEMGKSLTIEGCAQKNLEWYESCNAITQLCDQSVSKMMRVCLVNGNKESQCQEYGDAIYGYNFGSEECKPYFSKKPLKKACADTYQSIADYCKAVRKSK